MPSRKESFIVRACETTMDFRVVPVILIIIGTFCPRSVKTSRTNLFSQQSDLYDETNSKKTTRELVNNYSYPFQVHKLTTKDGYILELHRIPHSKTTTTNTRKTPILLIHGLFQDSANYVMNGEENSPGFIFANAGYDVWLHNSRGTTYSMEHESLSPDTEFEYWNFCFEDIGNNDLAGEVDYILSVTNAEKVYIIGFSIGGAASVIFLADNPSYNDKVASLFLLAPSISLLQETHQMVYKMRNIEQVLFVVLEDVKAVPYSDLLYDTCVVVCDGLSQMCYDFIQYFDDTNETDLDISEITKKLANSMSSVTIKMLRHLLQMVVTDDFLKFDYGPEVNLITYGQAIPPEYQLENITAPVTIFCATGDSFVLCEDLQIISSRFPNAHNFTVVPLEHHKHFSGGKDAKLYVYDAILSQMEVLETSSNSESTDTESFSFKTKKMFNDYYSVVAISFLLSLLALLGAAFSFILIRSCRKKQHVEEQQVLVTDSKPHASYN